MAKIECDKCGYKSAKNKELYKYSLCEFCNYFAPLEKEEVVTYVNEKVDWRVTQTYRKQEKIGGIRQKRGMKIRAKDGKVMSRAPFGYKLERGKLIPAKNSDMVERIYEEFLNHEISLNQLSKKHGVSVNGLKKILTNFTYLGKVKFDRQVHEGNHKPLISSTLFNHVQDKLDNVLRGKQKNRKPKE